MCTWWKTEFSCGCRLPKELERCGRGTCDYPAKRMAEVGRDCDQCFAKGEDCTRGRDGFGPHARRIRKEQKKLRQAQETNHPEQDARSMGSAVCDPVGPWLKSLPKEHSWKSPRRRASDDEWVREDQRRQRRGVPGASSTTSSVHERRDKDSPEHDLHHELARLNIAKHELDERDQERSHRRGWERVLRRRRLYDDEYVQPAWPVEHTPSHHSCYWDHNGQLVYDTGMSGPINPYHHGTTTTTVHLRHVPQYSPPQYGSPYSHGSSHGYGGSWSYSSGQGYSNGY